VLAFHVVRWFIGLGAAALFVLGLLALGALGPTIAAIWLLFLGSCGVVIALLERQRYRSEAAERTREPAGPGGGEPESDPLPARFRPTDERFVDPTSNLVMRVYMDVSTGERRYRAES